MRKVFIASLLVVTVQILCFAAESTNYTVASGDTLWSISEKLYNNPFEWPKIWQANKSLISNPDLILVNQNIVIPDKSAPMPQVQDIAPAAVVPASEEKTEQPAEVKAEEAPSADGVSVTETEAAPAREEQPAEEAAAEESSSEVEEEAGTQDMVEEESPKMESKFIGSKAVTQKNLEAESFVAPVDWDADGHVTGEKEKKLLISTGDTVYLNLGSDKVTAGTKCMVYRRLGRVRDQRNGDVLGVEIRRIAKIEVTDNIGETACTAKIVTMYDTVEIGDIVKIMSSGAQEKSR
ncbi:MAG TPA: hypothetical protein DEE98_01680 [Elusimicrobia bacterium]|nr:MAG: hypothetical protein A2278_06035 [Elusimicrobia bacterium RIFOXYA12_FULL_49_49]OGS10867.1 MAG: hypothetical protein A2386_06085 [Elusimicrobia bacterium RIFOXYB1_FULL_48_9]OGS16649.1 MAG: hypothetical protein A2251_04700 [Elusimicrobia bacterium RIFOXYA2_FULL_47_53]OGS25498.1 MAG: hypothetical protein A2339_00275 [Elusimicrobia bacterium RIFOXYB12_FULL_50_12]OGS31627.1 MAG: hypothetical protein A2323_03420 [Elusimicrobia bacterium RIFOXYB2_FULL_46_23]HBU69074.1 hypothetical protein [El